MNKCLLMFNSVCAKSDCVWEEEDRKKTGKNLFRTWMRSVHICQTYMHVCVYVSINDSKLHLVRRKTHWVEQMENWRMNRFPPILPSLTSYVHSFASSFVRDKFFWNMVEHHKIYTIWSSIVGNVFAITASNQISIGVHLAKIVVVRYYFSYIHFSPSSRMYQYNGTVYFTWFLRLTRKKE